MLPHGTDVKVLFFIIIHSFGAKRIWSIMLSVLYMETVVFDVSFHIIFFHVPIVLFSSIT